ncbi:ribbon-helix-helix protein, CopG family [Gemmatimonas sp.]|uniref:type II toxin-antitoxin system VapB family antitoxin n=2 Tax=Gemmatimonas sp. TaxID=1962908 RepID=UPI0031B8A8B6
MPDHPAPTMTTSTCLGAAAGRSDGGAPVSGSVLVFGEVMEVPQALRGGPAQALLRSCELHQCHIWYHMPTIKTTVYVDEADYRTLQALAAAGDRSAAELMREALHAFVEAQLSRTAGTAASRGVAETSPRYRVEPAQPAAAPLPSVASRLAEIQAIVRELPVLDPRPADEILGYDDIGLPT